MISESPIHTPCRSWVSGESKPFSNIGITCSNRRRKRRRRGEEEEEEKEEEEKEEE